MRAGRALAWVWGPVLLVVAAGAGVLQYLGPPNAAPLAPKPAPIAAPAPAASSPPAAPPAQVPGAVRGPRVALLVSGMGMSDADSEAVITATPGGVSLAFSPYAASPDQLLRDARKQGHEVLVSIPMEPQSYPVNDAGNEALLTSLSDAENATRLQWALSHFSDVAGATNALGGRLHGERFSNAANLMAPVMAAVAGRGLVFIDANGNGPGAVSGPGRRAVDVAVDEPVSAIDANLARLEQVARDRGAALGLVDSPTPVTAQKIAAWATALAQHGLTLVPASTLVSHDK